MAHDPNTLPGIGDGSHSGDARWPAERLPPRPWFFGDSHALRLPILDNLPELLGVESTHLGAQQCAVDGARLVDILPQLHSFPVETLRTLTHVVVWAGAEDVTVTERLLQKSPRRGLPGFFRADFANLLRALKDVCGPSVRPIIVRVATPNAVLCASVNAVLAAVAEKEGADIVWVEPVWEGSDRPVSGGRSDLGDDPMSLVLARALDYEATLARVADAIFTTPASRFAGVA